MSKPYSIIYCISNKINGLKYFGFTSNYKRRISQYKRFGCKGQTKLYDALVEFGWDNFQTEIVCECDDYHERNFMEKWFIALYDTYNNGYNATKGGSSDYTLSDISRKKISQGMMRDKNSQFNKNIYKFINKNGEIYEGYVYDLRMKYNIKSTHHLTDLLKGKTEYHGWLLYTDENVEYVNSLKSQNRKFDDNGVEIINLIHDSGKSFIGYAEDFQKEYNIKSISRLVCRRVYKIQGWSINGLERPKKISQTQNDIFNFININTKETFTGTRYDIANKYNLRYDYLSKVILGKEKEHRGWKLLK